MKLTKIDTYVIKVPSPHCGGHYWYFVKLSTDEGIYGWGEMAVLQICYELEKGFKAMMEGIFDKYLKGRNPLDIEKIFFDLNDGLSSRHSDYLVTGLISAIDIALWDIAGKAYKQPVYNLLGGKFRDKIRSYSYISYQEDTGKKNYQELWEDTEAVAERALEMVEMGFDALKFDPLRIHPRPRQVTLQELSLSDKIVAAVRKAVGDRADILIGTHGQLTTSSAIRFAKVIEPYNPLWFEEPVSPENTKEMAKVRKSTFIPIATGERLVGLFDFIRLLEDGSASILQPDLGSCGGITLCKKISSLGEAYYAEMAPHVWGGPVTTAAAIQIAANIPNFLIQESIGRSDAFYNALLQDPIKWESGYFIPFENSGIGIDLREDILKKYEA